MLPAAPATAADGMADVELAVLLPPVVLIILVIDGVGLVLVLAAALRKLDPRLTCEEEKKFVARRSSF